MNWDDGSLPGCIRVFGLLAIAAVLLVGAIGGGW